MSILCIKCRTELPDGAAYCHACGKKQVAEPRKFRKRANGTGTVYKLDGRRRRPWVAKMRGTILGYYATRTEALDALNERVRRPPGENYNLTFEEVYERWKVEHWQKISDKGKEMYATAHKHLTPLKNLKMREIRAEDYQLIVNKLAEKGRSHSTLSKVRQLASQMSQWAMREDIISTNYAQFIFLPKSTQKPKNIIPDEHIAKVEAAAKSTGVEADTARIMLLLLYSGMRVNELLRLPVANVNLEGGYIVGGSKTNAGRDRHIPILDTARPLFEHFVQKADPAGLLISGYEGNKVYENFRDRNYYPLLDKLGLPRYTLHTTRHTFITRAVEEGVSPEALMQIVGHAKYSTTLEKYTHFDVEVLKREMGKMKYNTVGY